MQRERLDVRLAPDEAERLRKIAMARGKTVSDVIRDLIDTAYEEIARARRIRAAEELSALEVFEFQEGDDIDTEIEAAHGRVDDLR
jgi:uncharacterized protein (DUF1778 family)